MRAEQVSPALSEIAQFVHDDLVLVQELKPRVGLVAVERARARSFARAPFGHENRNTFGQCPAQLIARRLLMRSRIEMERVGDVGADQRVGGCRFDIR